MGLGSGKNGLYYIRNNSMFSKPLTLLQSFHFAPRRVGETFQESVLRAEYYLALRTGMNASTKVLDVGCGVGGPARNLTSFTGADITGVTINDYQVCVGNKYNALKGFDKSCRYVYLDDCFM